MCNTFPFLLHYRIANQGNNEKDSATRMSMFLGNTFPFLLHYRIANLGNNEKDSATQTSMFLAGCPRLPEVRISIAIV